LEKRSEGPIVWPIPKRNVCYNLMTGAVFH